MTRIQANGLLLIAGAIWGMAFVAQSSAMTHVGPFLFIASRFIVASLVVLPFALMEQRGRQRSGTPVLTRRQAGQFAIIGCALFVGMGFQQVGLLTTSVTHSGFLTGLYVVFTPFLVVALFREWPHRVVWPAAALSFSGVFLLSGGSLHGLVIGDLLTVASAACWALQVVLVARYVTSSNQPYTLCLIQFGVTALLAVAVALVAESITLSAIVGALPEILYTGTLGSGIAFTLQVLGQRYTTAPQAALFLSSEAPFAALAGALLLGERIGLVGLVGCLLIFIAMLTVEIIPALSASRAQRQSSTKRLPNGTVASAKAAGKAQISGQRG